MRPLKPNPHRRRSLVSILWLFSFSLALLYALKLYNSSIALNVRQDDVETLHPDVLLQTSKREGNVAQVPTQIDENAKLEPPAQSSVAVGEKTTLLDHKRNEKTGRSVAPPLKDFARLLTYRLALTKPLCDLEHVYANFALFSAVTGRSSTPSLQCKVKSSGRYISHGSGIHCWGRMVKIDPAKVIVAQGGEDVSTVMGRDEQEEFARVEPGAFTIYANSTVCNRSLLAQYATEIRLTPYVMPVLESLCRIPPQQTAPCEVWDDTPTLLVHRYEYSNLYHTVTELLGAYVSVRSAIADGLMMQAEHVRVIFLDGHAKGNLDGLWSFVFNSGRLETTRIGQLRLQGGTLCLKRVIIAETGYSSEINIHSSDVETFNAIEPMVSSNPRWCVWSDLRGFSKVFSDTEHRDSLPNARKLVVFIARDRGSFPAHPRVNLSQTLQRSLSSEQLGQLRLRALELSDDTVEVRIAMLSDMPVKEQIGLIRSASVVISLHGAALAHMVWARPDTFFVELSPPAFEGRIHFPKMSARAGRYFARIGSLGWGFLNGEITVNLSPDMLESVVRWALLPTDTERLGKIPVSGVWSDVLGFSQAFADTEHREGLSTSRKLVVFIACDPNSIPTHPHLNLVHPLQRSPSKEQLDQLRLRARELSNDAVEVRIVMISDMPVKELAWLIRSASVVVSLHGAALNHMIWAKPETFFIDLSSPDHEGQMQFPNVSVRVDKYLARFGSPGKGFLNGEYIVTLTAEMLDRIVRWALLPTDAERLANIPVSGAVVPMATAEYKSSDIE